MLKYIVVLVFFLPWSCVNSKSTDDNAFLSLESHLDSSRATKADGGFKAYLDGNLVSSGLLQQGHLFTDKLWEVHWEDPTLNRKLIFWSTETYQKVRDNNRAQWDLGDMKGFDFSPLIVYMDNLRPWKGKRFVQHHFVVPSAVEKSVWEKDGLRYYFKPKGAKYNAHSKLPQFVSQHPEYKLPKNKMSILNFSFDGLDDTHILRQGHSAIFSYKLPLENRSCYDYDNWLYAAGCPKASSTSSEAVVKWLDEVDPDVLLRSFIDNFYRKYKDYNYVVMNWEAIGWAYGASFWKLQRCFDYWNSKQTSAKLAVWGKGGFVLNRLQIESNDYRSLLTKATIYKQDLSTFRKGISQSNPLAVDDFFANNVDILFIGGYLNYPTNYAYVHHIMIQHTLNKMYFPKKKSILSWWNHQEYVGDFEKTLTSFKDNKGNFIQKVVKPMVFPDAMHNASMWAHAVCDGADLWSEPYARMQDDRYLGASTEVYDERGRKLKTRFKPNSSSQSVLQNHQNIDRWEAAKWAVSQHKDIVEEVRTEWVYKASKRSGINDRFTRGEEVLPATSLYRKTPLVAEKASADGKEVLLLVYDAWADPTKKQTILVKSSLGEIAVETYGKYTSLVRFGQK